MVPQSNTMKKYSWPAFFFLFFACQKTPDGYQTITVKGSDTEVNVALALAEAFMADDAGVSIAVTGGGSGAGIAALINGKTSIANASRPMKPSELALAQERGIEPLPIIFATDALAVAVHESLPLEAVSMEQLAQVFSGKTTNWQALGGPDLPISLYGRQSNSGTFVFFRDSVLRSDYAQQLKQMNGTAQIVEAIKQDRAGIGYVGAGYVLREHEGVTKGIKVLKIKQMENSPAVFPTQPDGLLNDRYPLVRPLFQYTDGQPEGQLRDFILFGLGAAGQQIVQENGYFPLLPAYADWNKKNLAKHDHTEANH